MIPPDREEFIGTTEAPTVPCEACAEARQRAVLIATAVGAVAGVGLFYLFTRYAAK